MARTQGSPTTFWESLDAEDLRFTAIVSYILATIMFIMITLNMIGPRNGLLFVYTIAEIALLYVSVKAQRQANTKELIRS